MNTFKVTVITVCRNAEKNIEETIKSVMNQTYTNMEYLIIDGLSSDSTLSIVNRYTDNRMVKCYSEKDKGIYDAMNKGVRYASGDYVIFMNAGDTFCENDVIDRLMNKLALHRVDIIYGGFLKKYKSRCEKIMIDKGNIWSLMAGQMPCHQSILAARRTLINSPFDLNYKIRSDYHWLLQCRKKRFKFAYVPICVSMYSMDGISMRSKYKNTFNKETQKSLKEFCKLPDVVWKWYEQLYITYIEKIRKEQL